MAVQGLGLLALMRGVPALQSLLQPIGGGLRCHGAEQHPLAHLGQLIPQLGGAAREDLGGDPDGGVTLIPPLHHLFGRRVGGLEEVVGEGEEPRQRVGIELGKLGGGQPLQEGHGGLLVLAGRVHPHADVGVIGKEATVTLFGHRGAHDTEVHLAGEGGYLPGAGRIEGGLA